jgi:hypothetical protein
MALHLALWALFFISLWLWKTPIFAYQWLVQTVLSVVIFIAALRHIRHEMAQAEVSATFSPQGEWDYHAAEAEDKLAGQWRISAKSRVTEWLIWLHLRSVIDPKQSHWCMVFYDQLSPADYRRLCRAVLFVQQEHV